MRLLSAFLLAVAACGLNTAPAFASPEAPKAGVEYTTLETAQPTRAAPGKIEVIEFFSYACPHCRAFDPVLAAWVKKNEADVTFRRVHVAFNAGEAPLQRMYTTFEAMGLADKLHSPAFAALHEEHLRLASAPAIVDWVARNGVDRARFEATYNSFGMPSRVAAAQASLTGFRVDHWPSIGIDGRFYTSPSKVATAMGTKMSPEAQYQVGLQVMDFLVAKAKAEKK